MTGERLKKQSAIGCGPPSIGWKNSGRLPHQNDQGSKKKPSHLWEIPTSPISHRILGLPSPDKSAYRNVAQCARAGIGLKADG